MLKSQSYIIIFTLKHVCTSEKEDKERKIAIGKKKKKNGN